MKKKPLVPPAPKAKDPEPEAKTEPTDGLPTTMGEVVYEAWQLREEIRRRLHQCHVDMYQLLQLIDALDAGFAGQEIPKGRT
jgi:hypothetical protein